MNIENVKNKSVYDSIGFYSLSILLVLLPVFIIPNEFVNFAYAKVGLILLFVTVAFISFVLDMMNERKIGILSWFYSVPLLLLPTVYTVSAFFSKDTGAGLIGSGTHIDSLFFLSLMILLGVLVSRFFNSKQNIFSVSLLLIAVSTLIFLFHVLRFIFGVDFLSFSVFLSLLSNTVGSFGDLGILSGLVLILSILTLDFLNLDRKLKIGLYVSIALSLVILLTTNFNLVIGFYKLTLPVSLSLLIAVFSLLVFVHKKVTNPKGTFPITSLVVFLIALVCTVQIGSVTSFAQNVAGINSSEILDVRITPESTTQLAYSLYREGIISALIGVGPNNFRSAWAFYRPASINLTAFWNQDFNFGSSYVLTSMVTTGILGTLAWVLFILLIVYSICILLKTTLRQKDALSLYSALIVSSATIYLWLILLLYTPSYVIIALTFIFTGLLGSLLLTEGLVTVRYYSWEKVVYKKSFMIVFTLVVLITASIGVGFVWVNKFISSVYYQKAEASLVGKSPDIQSAQNYVTKAIYFSPSTENLRLYSNIHLMRPFQLINKIGGIVPDNQIPDEVKSDINKSFQIAQYAVIGKGNSFDYQDWLQFGKVNESATFLGSTSTADIAVKSYAQAALLSPNNPTPLFLIGRMFMYAGKKDVAREYFEKAIQLKPNFSEAINMLQSIDGKSNVEVNTSPVSSSTPPAVKNKK